VELGDSGWTTKDDRGGVHEKKKENQTKIQRSIKLPCARKKSSGKKLGALTEVT